VSTGRALYGCRVSDDSIPASLPVKLAERVFLILLYSPSASIDSSVVHYLLVLCVRLGLRTFLKSV
jgi:hypothetical protein